ncbi:MAG: methylmalonyl Co-A mutase-associated GTPase MeaB [Flavobacteriales bacterium]
MSETVTTEKILSGERLALSKAITLIESTREEDRKAADKLLNELIGHSGKSIRIGISGVPGVGKSTFIEALGMTLINKGHKVAVLAVDPSSNQGKGSILGDKTRMSELSAQKNAFIRPSPSSGSLGGVAAKTRESIVLCEAAGFDVIIVETVGVGQSEIAVSGMVDFFLLLMLAGAGDELQGIKRGIMEIADLIVVNKADGDNVAAANAARQAYARALQLFSVKDSGWTPAVLTCSAIEQKGLDAILTQIEQFKIFVSANGFFTQNRKKQEIEWFENLYMETVGELLRKNSYIQKAYQQCIEGILKNNLTPGSAAGQMKETLIRSLT